MAARGSLYVFQSGLSRNITRPNQSYSCVFLNSFTRAFPRQLTTTSPFRHTAGTFITPLHQYPSIINSSRLQVNSRIMSTSANKPLSYTERIKVILKEYGAVGVAFHTVMSLSSVGTCYLLVDNGLDVSKILDYFNVESSVSKKGASTFAIAYVFHKFLLPVRATITVVSVPVIVRNLRLRGWMKGQAKP